MRVSTTFNIKSKPIIILVLFACLACITQKVHGDIIAASTFDTDADGWTLTSVGHSWESTGGNPDGYIRYDDNKGGTNYILAPEKFLGNWAAMGVTNLIYEVKIFYTGSVYIVGTYWMVIEGPGGSARWYGPPPDPAAGWLSLDVPVIEGEWVILSGSWDALLADITELRVAMEFYNNWGPFEITGIDNFQLFGEPASIEVSVDVKPGSFPSSVNLKSKGVTPVAIHTTDDFDAADVDPETVRLDEDGCDIAAVKWERYDCDEFPNPLYGEPGEPEMIGDGDIDLVLYFETSDLGCLGDVTEVELTGTTFGGVAIVGTSDIRFVKQGKP